MSTEKPDAYGVWDTQEKKWFRRGYKVAWCSKSAAANAWNAARGDWRSETKDAPKFSEQARFVSVGIRFAANETIEEKLHP